MMKAVHFGAGNIGRGFIGLLLHQSNYDVYFVDVNEQIIDAINKEGQYNVFLANDAKDKLTVNNIKGINSKTNLEDVIEAIATANIVTTAIGPSILKFIAPAIAEGLKARMKNNQEPLNIIACENMIGGSAELKKFVADNLAADEIKWMDETVGFPNSAVDRIVPNQHNENILDVLVEPFHEWVIDETEIKGTKPDIAEAHFVPNLQAYIERKLFTVNTGHASTAYLAYVEKFATIAEAITNESIQKKVLGALEETGRVLVKKYQFDESEHNKYIHKIIGRFANAHIVDDVNRVGRSPIRKLGINDRLVAPALQYIELFDEMPTHLIDVMAAALTFYTPDDAEAVQLKEWKEEKGIVGAIETATTLQADHPLVKAVHEAYNRI